MKRLSIRFTASKAKLPKSDLRPMDEYEARTLELAESENVRENHNSRITTIGLVIAIVTAIGSAGLQLYSAHGTNQQVRESLEADAERADEEFMRDEKQEAYSEFYSAAASLFSFHTSMYYALVASLASPLVEFDYDAMVTSYLNAENLVSQEQAPVRIVGTKSADRAAYELFDILHDLFITNLRPGVRLAISVDRNGLDRIVATYDLKMVTAIYQQKKFVEAARADIQAYDGKDDGSLALLPTRRPK